MYATERRAGASEQQQRRAKCDAMQRERDEFDEYDHAFFVDAFFFLALPLFFFGVPAADPAAAAFGLPFADPPDLAVPTLDPAFDDFLLPFFELEPLFAFALPDFFFFAEPFLLPFLLPFLPFLFFEAT